MTIEEKLNKISELLQKNWTFTLAIENGGYGAQLKNGSECIEYPCDSQEIKDEIDSVLEFLKGEFGAQAELAER